MLRNKRIIKTIALAISFMISVIMVSSTVFADGITYEIYNGSNLIQLTEKPFIYDDNYYLPLRDTLNAFGITDISFDNGTITINMPGVKGSNPFYSTRCEISPDSYYINYTDGYARADNMVSPPVIRDGITYVTEYFFYNLIHAGQIPGFHMDVKRNTSPECYYEDGEEVFIGTAQEHDEYYPDYPVKRIIVDENRNTLAVITVENQQTERITEIYQKHIPLACTPFSHLYSSGIFSINASGEYVPIPSGIMIMRDIMGENKLIAYIPHTCQISLP